MVASWRPPVSFPCSKILVLNKLRPRQNGRHFANDILQYIMLNEKYPLSIEIILRFVPRGIIDNRAVLVQTMAWHRSGDKPLSEPMASSPMHKFATQPRRLQYYYNDVMISAMVSQITSLAIVYSTVYSGAYQIKHRSSASGGIFAGNSPVTGEFHAQRHDVIIS